MPKQGYSSPNGPHRDVLHQLISSKLQQPDFNSIRLLTDGRRLKIVIEGDGKLANFIHLSERGATILPPHGINYRETKFKLSEIGFTPDKRKALLKNFYDSRVQIAKGLRATMEPGQSEPVISGLPEGHLPCVYAHLDNNSIIVAVSSYRQGSSPGSLLDGGLDVYEFHKSATSDESMEAEYVISKIMSPDTYHRFLRTKNGAFSLAIERQSLTNIGPNGNITVRLGFERDLLGPNCIAKGYCSPGLERIAKNTLDSRPGMSTSLAALLGLNRILYVCD